MTVLEIDHLVAATVPPPSPGQAWRQPEARAEIVAADGRAVDPQAGGWESAHEAVARLAAAHVPDGVNEGPGVAVEVQYRGKGGRHKLAATGRMYAGQSGGRPFAAVLAVADPLVLLTWSHAGQGAARWALVPGGPSVPARADALRLVRAMRCEGELLLQAAGQPPLPPFALGAGEQWTEDDEREWQLFEDLATLEEWAARRS